MNFPIFLNIENKKILIIGGGRIGARKAETLKRYGGKITVYSEKVTGEGLLEQKDIRIINENVTDSEEDIRNLVRGYFMVIAATDNHGLNDKVSSICMEEDILVNNVSSRTEMNIMFGAVVMNDEFQVAVSTDGRSCKRSKALKGEIKKLLERVSDIGKADGGKN